MSEADLFRATNSSQLDLNALFNALPSPYMLLDTSLTLVGMNEAYLKVTGRTREEIVGRHVFDAFPSDPQSLGGRQLRDSLARVIATGRPDELALIPYTTERPGVPPVMRYWSATHTPLFDRDGRVEYVVQHTEDVTELVELRAEQQARDLQRQQGVLDRAARVEARNFALSAETDQLRALFAQAPSFMALLSGPTHVFELANDSYQRLIGQRELIGRPVAEALPEVVEQGFVRLLDEVRSTGVPFVGRTSPVLLADPQGNLSRRYLDFIYQPIRDADASISGIFVQGHDVTEQKFAEERLARQSAVLELAQQAGGIGTFEWDLGSRLLTGSETFFALYGIAGAPGPVSVDLFTGAVHEEDRGKLTTVASADQLANAAQRQEYRVVGADGTVRWLVRQGAVIRDDDGRPLRVVGAAYDITERKEAETQTRLLMQEMAHRVKNMLAIFSAITSQTLRSSSSLEGARLSLERRLAALAQAQDSLMQGSWSSASIGDVVLGAARLMGQDVGRIRTSGPDLMLDPKAVLGVALLLHELGTNALKYGALSQPDGSVTLTWEELADRSEPMLKLTWREAGGPVVRAPERRGFGSRLIERGLSSNLGGEVRLDYRPEGLVCEAEIRMLPPALLAARKASAIA